MGTGAARERAVQPEDAGRPFMERANTGDVEGMVALREREALLAYPPGQVNAGTTRSVARTRACPSGSPRSRGSDDLRCGMAVWPSP
jgi:hypothetical protein